MRNFSKEAASMKVYRTDEIRNVVLLGHGGSGKTSLAEAMAYVSGATNRMGSVENGNTISDFDKEAILRYNESDIIYLPELMLKMMDDFCAVTGLDHETAWRVMIQHGEYVQTQAKAEDVGIPINCEHAANLGHNYELAKDHLIGSLCELYPFYERAKPTSGELIGD